MSGTDDSALQALLDERAIRNVVLRYCRGVDRLDEDLVRSCYHPDASDEHGSFSGDVEAYIEWSFGLLRDYDATMHFIGNQLVEVHHFVFPFTVSSHHTLRSPVVQPDSSKVLHA